MVRALNFVLVDVQGFYWMCHRVSANAQVDTSGMQADPDLENGEGMWALRRGCTWAGRKRKTLHSSVRSRGCVFV